MPNIRAFSRYGVILGIRKHVAAYVRKGDRMVAMRTVWVGKCGRRRLRSSGRLLLKRKGSSGSSTTQQRTSIVALTGGAAMERAEGRREEEAVFHHIFQRDKNYNSLN
jgi:hypothetical protein